ncbi:putative ferric-chelate reductase 1 isoform X2, partial [Clarias magur]
MNTSQDRLKAGEPAIWNKVLFLFTFSIDLSSGENMRFFLLLLGCVWVCESYPNGQVSSSCDNMTPSHGTSTQTSPPPYTVTADTSSYKPGDTIT